MYVQSTVAALLSSKLPLQIVFRQGSAVCLQREHYVLLTRSL
jgi:hypothetical protein